ncbi:MAG TPA: hypothetical protein VNJ01_11050 [Bacteriovoracaceae bacterium]|nr:hypothetical protein [Bacteriovoracaceae bacterium]
MKIHQILCLIIFTLVLLAQVSKAQAQRVATIPFNDSRLPGDDLVYGNRVLRADEAHQLSKDGIDLSTLNPAHSAVWNGPKQTLGYSEDRINLMDSETVDYKGALLSANGLFRFNVTARNVTAIVHLDKTLHTILLRKNILRLMGYKVPAMKWVPKLKVNFSNVEEMKTFTLSHIPRATLGAATRWAESITFETAADMDLFLKDETEDSGLRKISQLGPVTGMVLRDIAVTEPKAEDHYTLALGTPPQNLTSRTLRALLLPFALLDLGESANKQEWTVGRISNNEVQLPHFTRSIFPTSMDDAKWSLGILKDITPDQLKMAIDLAYFPHEAGLLLFEKLKSRRNALMKIFSITTPDYPVNQKISYPPALVDGKLKKEDWKGYASRFAHGDPESPFKDVHWYALSKLQSIAMDNLVARANQELVLFNPSSGRTKFIIDQFTTGLNHFVQTGEFLSFPIATWVSPVADVALAASRDVVVGNYLGTDNLVQLADTVGWNIQLGAHLGIENFEFMPTISVRETVSISKSWTHLKPLKNLKQSFKEPYKNIAVPLIKWQLGKDLDRLKSLGSSTNPDVDWNLKKDDSSLSQVMEHLNQNLGVGESLLFMERLVPVVGIAGKTNGLFQVPVDLKVQLSSDMLLIRRTQLYRKDAKTIQIYDDVGHGLGWSVDLSLEKFIPLIRLGWRKQKGDYSIRLHEVNIDSDPKENPKLFDSAHALAEFIQTGSSELLETIKKPNRVNAEFVDKSSRMAILSWRNKKLKTHTKFDIKSRDGLTGKYVLFTDEKQTGWNWESFTKDFINLTIKKVVSGVEWASPAFQNPAETIMGMGTTTSVRFEAALATDGAYDERFMRLTDRWEGWSAKVKSVKEKMTKVNAKFGSQIFDQDSLNNTEKLKLFNVAVNLNLYEDGIARLTKIPDETLIQIKIQTEQKNNQFNSKCGDSRTPQTLTLSSGTVIKACGPLVSLLTLNDDCRKKLSSGKPQEEVTKCHTKLFRELYEELDFKSLTEVLGKDNIFVHGSVNGFRDGDEILNDAIPSNTSGRIGSRYWNGPFDIIQQMLGIQAGEFNGYWLRDRL